MQIIQVLEPYRNPAKTPTELCHRDSYRRTTYKDSYRRTTYKTYNYISRGSHRNPSSIVALCHDLTRRFFCWSFRSLSHDERPPGAETWMPKPDQDAAVKNRRAGGSVAQQHKKDLGANTDQARYAWPCHTVPVQGNSLCLASGIAVYKQRAQDSERMTNTGLINSVHSQHSLLSFSLLTAVIS